MLHELCVGVVEQKVVMDERLSGDNAEQVNQAFRSLPDMGANDFAACGRIKDGKIDIGIGISGVKEAAEADRVRGLPYLENAVDVNQVFEKGAVLVPALASSN